MSATGAEVRTTKTKGRGERHSLWGPVFAAPHGIGLALFTVVPIGMAAAMSLFAWPMIGERSWVGLDNYVALVQDPTFRAAARNTLLFVVLYVPGNLAVSLGMAAWLSPRIRHRHVFRVIFFVPTVSPIVANVVVWRMIYQPDGLIDASMQSVFGVNAPNFLEDTSWAMIAIVVMSIWQGFGYNMLIFSSALDGVPSSQLEAAALDGAGSWRTFWNVQFRLISPAVFFATVMTLITSFQVFIQPFILTRGGPGDATITLVQFIYNQGFMFQNLGLAAAGAWILFVVILGVTAVQFIGQRRWVHYD